MNKGEKFDQNEMDRIEKEYREMMLEEEREELQKHSEQIDSFQKHCLELGIELNEQSFGYSRPIGITATHPDLLKRLCPSIIVDKEGLYRISDLENTFTKKPFIGGYYFSSNFVAMAHPFFRRGHNLDSNYTPHFIDLFWTINEPNIEHFIALEMNRVRINVDDSCYLEKDTWYGAKFNNNIQSIPDNLVKLAPPVDMPDFIISLYFSNVAFLDIKWESSTDGIKTFKAEELKTSGITIEKNGKIFHPIKYIHAEYDIAAGNFRHFDGAIHLYTPDEYKKRVNSDLNYNLKGRTPIKAASKKLFKLNGKVSIETWIELTSHFLQGNPLIYEYFEGSLPEHVQFAVEAIRKQDAN